MHQNDEGLDIESSEMEDAGGVNPYELEADQGHSDDEEEIPYDSALQKIRGTANPNLTGGYKKKSPFSKNKSKGGKE